MAPRHIVGIDIGTFKICTVIAQIDRDDRITVLGSGMVPSKGVDHGMVVNLEEATRAVQASVEKAEAAAGYRIQSAYVSIAGRHIRTYNRRGATAVTHGRDGMVIREDMLHAIETAQAEPLPSNYEVLHVMPYRYILDGKVVRDPIGMPGYRLEVDVHVVVCENTAIHNLIKIVQDVGVEIDDIVLQPLAAAEGVLTSDDCENGVVLIEIGAGTTSLAFIAQGNTWHTAVIPVGGQTFTNDIIMTFQMSPHSAEHNKQTQGSALADATRDTDLMRVEGSRAGEYIEVSRKIFNQCIQARADELIDFILYEVEQSIYDGAYATGIVLTGGGAKLNDIDLLFESRFSATVRIGMPRNMVGVSDALNSPAFATAVGLVRWGYRHGNNDDAGLAPEEGRWVELYEQFKAWLREFLP